MSARARHRRCWEAGFTMVEVTIAMALALLVVAAGVAIFVLGNNSSVGGSRQVQLLSLAQQQLENVRQAAVRYGFADLFMNAAPGAPDPSIPANPLNPNDYVNTSASPNSFYVEENYNNNGGNLAGNVATGTPSAGEPLIVNSSPPAGTPGIAPVNASVAAGGGGTATVYTFITQVAEACNGTLAGTGGAASCTSSASQQDVRRVVVAVKYDNASGETPVHPQYLTTIISNPVPSNVAIGADGLRIGVNIGASAGVGR